MSPFLPLPTEEESMVYFRIMRVLNPFNCTSCKDSIKHYWIQYHKAFRCAKCRHKTTLKSGTLLQSSKLTYQQWFLALHLMSDPRKSISACEMQKLLGIKCYRTAFKLMHKIRNSMSQYEQKRIRVGIDEYVKTRCKMNLRTKAENRKKHCLLIHNERSEKGVYQISMLATEDMKKHKPNRNAMKGQARSHKWRQKDMKGIKRVRFTEVKYWIQTHYDNFEKNMKGVYQGISSKYRQLYLDEFCFRTNLSMAGEDVFKVLVTHAVSMPWYD